MKAVTKEPELQTALFDYSAFDRQTRTALQTKASEIKALAKRVASDIVKIGGLLVEAKDLARSTEKFHQWLDLEFHGWSERTPYNYMAVWQAFHDKNLSLENVATSALYLLAAPSTPPEAVEQATQIANSGGKVTNSVAKEIVRQAKDNEAARRPKLIPEPEPGETPNLFPQKPSARLVKSPENLPFPTARSAAEISRMANLRWFHSDNTPVEICHLEGPGGRQRPFVVTDWETDGDGYYLAVDAWPLTPIQDYKGIAPITYQDFLDSERPADDLSGIKVNCGSKTKPVWYVITGSKTTFTKEQTCRKCGCTDNDCRQCIARTGERCYWVSPGLCSACAIQPAPAAPGKRPTTDQMKADNELEKRWRGLNVRISITLAATALNRSEPRLVFGSINADRHRSLNFNVRDDDPDAIGATIAQALRQFRSELPQREESTTAKPAPAKAPARPATSKPPIRNNSKKPPLAKGKPVKPAKKGRR